MNTSTFAKASAIAFLLMLTACGGGGSDNNDAGSSVTSATELVDWTWVSGSDVVNDAGQFVTAPLYPGSLEGAVSWTDATGNLWLFGGGGCTLSGCGDASHYIDFQDLWKFDGTNWALVKGYGFTNQVGTYGILGTANANNQPGSRQYGATWVDGAGHFWMFGGRGRDSNAPGTSGTDNFGNLNDLWQFDGQDWIWQGGSDTKDAVGSYSGTLQPGARMDAVSWTDSAGNLWMFGGYGNDTVHSLYGGYLNDLWKFDGTQWAWVSGSSTRNQTGDYGVKGTADPANVPGARSGASTWIDANDVLWLFGGIGIDSAGSTGNLNDLWKFDGTSWTWVGGSDTVDASGQYGTPGTFAAGNSPAARRHAVQWADASGNFWMFGGQHKDTNQTGQPDVDLNDLWKFDGTSWTWMSGSREVNQHGIYGSKGSTDIANIPGARDIAVSWVNANGFWLFGGQGFGSEDGSGISSYGYLSDLWHFQPR